MSDDKIDHTNSLPDDCLTLIFNYLTTTDNLSFNYLTTTKDRTNSSLVSHRWLRIEAQTRTKLTLYAHSDLQTFLSSIFTRFNSLTELGLYCKSPFSINDDVLILIASGCPNLTRLKLRAGGKITDDGMAILSQNCKNLKKLSCSSYGYGAESEITLLNSQLSIKLRDYKHLSEPLIIVLNDLKTLELRGYYGDYDRHLNLIMVSGNSLIELHLEWVDISDECLLALSKCSSLVELHLVKLHHASHVLISAVENCKGLKKLCIDDPMGWMILKGDLIDISEYCMNLEELVLIGVDACHFTLEAFAVNCPKLERLELCSSKTITDVEISHIAKKCVALKKLLIKKCYVSDKGVEAFALGCPNLAEISLTNCENVTSEVKDRLRARRGSLVVKLEI